MEAPTEIRTVEDIAAFANLLEYKHCGDLIEIVLLPYWTHGAPPDDPDALRVQIVSRPLDACQWPHIGPGRVRITMDGIRDLPAPIYDALLFVREMVHAFEKHEADEWLRFAGELVHNPHPEGL